MWHVALESWQWIHQVAVPCNVIRGSGMTCHWIRPVAAPCNVTRSSGIMTLNSPGGSNMQYGRWRSGMTCHWIRPNVRHISIRILHLVSISTISPQSTFKMVDLSHLGFYGSIIGSLKSPCTTFYRSSIETIAVNCLIFEKIAFFCILATCRQTNKRTDGQHRSTKPLSLSRAAA